VIPVEAAVQFNPQEIVGIDRKPHSRIEAFAQFSSKAGADPAEVRYSREDAGFDDSKGFFRVDSGIFSLILCIARERDDSLHPHHDQCCNQSSGY